MKVEIKNANECPHKMSGGDDVCECGYDDTDVWCGSDFPKDCPLRKLEMNMNNMKKYILNSEKIYNITASSQEDAMEKYNNGLYDNCCETWKDIREDI